MWRPLFIATLALSLVSCFQVQLSGPVGGADISVSLLRSPSAAINSTESWSLEFVRNARGEEKWQSYNGIQRLMWLGIFLLGNSEYNDSEL